ncbi:MAG: hypothetical protein ACR2O8_04980 [Rhizobiaceae bacterium]
MTNKTYSGFMREEKAHLTLKIDTEQPVELRDFVGSFTSLANEFERFIKASYPDAKSNPKMFVREVRYGCIEADMIAGFAAVAMTQMDQILILEDFVKRWGTRFLSLRNANAKEDELNSNRELKDWADAAKSISSDPVALHRLQAATFEGGKRQIKAEFIFDAPDARTALQNIEDRKLLLAAPTATPHERVLMVYTRTDVHDATINKKSAERVLINQISDVERPVVYASEMAEQEIREHIREADENVYKRGFVVDVVEELNGDKVIAYGVTAFHSVIDID